MTKLRPSVAPMLLFVWLAAAAPARAACTVSVTALVFGRYDVFATTPLDTTGTISFTCYPPADVRISLTRGGSSTYLPRRLSGPSILAYNLYMSSAGTTIWGDETEGTAAYHGKGKPAVTRVTIYGRIPAAQDVGAGNYSDTITVVIDF